MNLWFVDNLQPLEDPVEDGTSDTAGGHGGLLTSLALGHLNDLIVIPSGMGVVWDGCTQC